MPVSPASMETICQAHGLVLRGAALAVCERVWRAPTNMGEVAIKIYRPGQQARAHTEASLLAHLQSHPDPGFRVQVPLAMVRDTRHQHPLDAPVLVTRWESGHTRTYDTFTLPEWQGLGAALACLHTKLDLLDRPEQHTLQQRLQAIDVDEWRRSLHTELYRARANGDAGLLGEYVSTCLRLLDQHYSGSVDAFPVDDKQRPIHNDYNQFNYLFGNTLPPVILDWEASIGAPREFELVRCMNHLPLESPGLARAFVHAYLAVRPLRVERLTWAVDAACLQHALKRWVVEGWNNDRARFAPHLEGSLRMATMMDGARKPLIDFYHQCLETARQP